MSRKDVLLRRTNIKKKTQPRDHSIEVVTTQFLFLLAELYDSKDPYGNKDLLPAAKSLRMLDNVIKQLETLPTEYKDFYSRQLISRIEAKCLSSPL